jgi:hypothetical protein
LPCDDGNNINGDGCSKDCQVEVGFTCYGGSPNSKDTCTQKLPSVISIQSRGQSRLYGQVVINVAVNYIPPALIGSANDCANNCKTVLTASIVKGFQGAASITPRYIPTTSYTFSIVVDFGKEPIGQFTLQVGINQNLKQQYFTGIDISSTLQIDVSPAYLSQVIDQNISTLT